MRMIRAAHVKDDIMAVSYTEELQSMLEEVTLRGNPNKKDVAKLCSVIFRLNERLNEAELAVEDLNEEIELLKAVKLNVKKPAAKTQAKD